MAADNDEEGELPSALLEALRNPYIFSKVLSCLDIASLQNCRLTSKQWSTEASRQLKIRGTLYFGKILPGSVTNIPNYHPGITNFLKFESQFVCQNVNAADISISKDNNIIVFLKKSGHLIKQLTIDSVKSLSTWIKHTPNLTSVTILKNGRGRQFAKNPDKFTQIQHLQFHLCYSEHSNFCPESQTISDGLIATFPNLTSLYLHEDDWMCEGLLIQNMLQLIANNPKWSPNLQKLEIRSRKNGCTKVDLFANLARRWRMLRMGRVLLENDEDLAKFQDLLKNCSSTLTELEFQLAFNQNSGKTCETIKFPKLPILRRIEMQFCTGTPTIEPFQYSDLFPCLQHIRYKHKEVFCRPTLWQTLFPKDGKECKTVTTLDLVGLEDDEGIPYFSRLFPMACNISERK